MKDYHDLYLKCYVLLSADRFKKFRNNILKNYRFNPNHNLRAPALSWNATLNTKKVELKLISDTGMCLVFEKGMRGGVSYISKRYSKANNKYLKFYDPKQELKHIYLDANNLCCCGMSKFLTINRSKI